jgi:protoporphyrinogen oxidase
LELDDELQWIRTRTAFLASGRLHPLTSAWDFLRFPLLNLRDKLRLGWTIWHASRLRDWRELEQIPLGEWLVRHSGRRTFERLWLPLLKAKLGDAWQRASAAFIWATIQRLYAARRTGDKSECFGYLPGGYARTLAALQAHLQRAGVAIQTGARVSRIERDENGLFHVDVNGERLCFDRVLVTTPAPLAAALCPQLTGKERQRLEQIEYVGIICPSLLLQRPLAGYYVTNLLDPAPFTGVIEMSALVDASNLNGHGLLYLPKYVLADDPLWQRTDEQIRADFIAALARTYPGFEPADVLTCRVSRVRHVFALSTLNYSQQAPPTATSVPGLFLVNSAQIVNGTLNVNETVRLAESSLPELCHPRMCEPVAAVSPIMNADHTEFLLNR